MVYKTLCSGEVSFLFCHNIIIYLIIIIIIIIYLLILRVLHVQMLTRALQYNNYLTVHTQIRKKNYTVHFVTINNDEEKKVKTTAIDSLYNLCNC